MATEAPNPGAVEPRPWASLVDMPKEDTPNAPAVDKPEPTETLDADTPETAPDAELTEEAPETPTVDPDEEHRGYLRHADYTKKQQAVANERRAVEAERRRLAAEAETVKEAKELLGLMRANPEWTQEVYDSAQRLGINAAPSDQEPTLTPSLSKLERRAQEVLQQAEINLLAGSITNERERLRREYKFSDEEAKSLVLQAFEDEILDARTAPDKVGRKLATVFKAAASDRAKAQGRRELKDTLQAGRQAASVGARPAAQKPQEHTGPMGWRKAEEAALEAVRKVGRG